MTRTKSFDKYRRGKQPSRITERLKSLPVRMDAWRWIDSVLILCSFVFLIAGRFTFIPWVFILLTVIELVYEAALRRSNSEWLHTSAGERWIGRMTAAGRLVFIPLKFMLFLITLFLLSVN